jgi:membrane protein YdbS with pleckstrin-like domain
MSLINKIMDKYENLSVRKKAFIDIVGMFAVAITAVIVITLITSFNLWMETVLALSVVVLIGVTKTVYDFRVWQHTISKELKK